MRGFLLLAASLVVAIGVGLAALVGAGASASPANPKPRGAVVGGVCSTVGTLERLVVVRNGISENHLRFSIAPRIVVARPQQVRAAARALCALPPVPDGIRSCPADFGTTYAFTFFAAHARFAPIVLDPSGCEIVSGLDPSRWAATTPQFYRVIGAALGIANATAERFGGTFAGS